LPSRGPPRPGTGGADGGGRGGGGGGRAGAGGERGGRPAGGGPGGGAGGGGAGGGGWGAGPAGAGAPPRRGAGRPQRARPPEREAFGFYFAAHPVSAWREVATANGARTYAGLMEGGVPGGGRSQAMMAALVEGVNIGKTRKGRDFIRADFSDATGQFSAACFEEGLVAPFRQWAADGTCVLLTVELDAPSPDEPPRITVRHARPLSEVTADARMVLVLDLLDELGLEALKQEIGQGGDGTGEVMVRVQLGGGRQQQVLLGRNFTLDGELAERLASAPGLANVALSARRGPARLKLVA